MSIRLRLILLPGIGSPALLFCAAAARLNTVPAQPACTDKTGGANHYALPASFVRFQE